MDSLWNDQEELAAKRKEYLGTEQIKELLRKGPIQFVIANVGDKLTWIDIANTYKIYKSRIKERLIDDLNHIDLENFKDNIGYMASSWEINPGISIILLEVYH